VRSDSFQQLVAGDKFLLIDSSNPDVVSFTEKVIESTETEMKFFKGWDMTVERAHLFLTKESGDTSSSYVAIEHNVISCYYYSLNCGACWQQCTDCPKGYCCQGAAWWQPWGTCGACC